MKNFKAYKVLTYRMDIIQALKELPEENTMFPYRFQWRPNGRKVRRVELVCNKDKAVWLDIQYFDEPETELS